MVSNPLSGNPLRTRADVQRAAADLFSPLLPYFSSSGARVRLSATSAHFDQAAADLEGFARPLWGIVPLVAGGGQFEHWDLYRRGLANGTDPEHPDYWGEIGDKDQRQVELASLGFTLRLAREHIWDPLDERAKKNVANYLISGREHEFVDSNWKFFRILIDLGLEHCGIGISPAKREKYLDDIDGFAMEEGWYRDGPIRSADHYIPFAFHYYGLIYAVLSGDTARADRFKDRAREFAGSIKHWYGKDGSALPFGRSLTYRFAHAGYWGALAFAGVEALSWGQIKGYFLRNLRWWAGQAIFDRDGVLSVGYCYPNLLMSEGYNSAGSPYWAMKAFLPLALAEDHPFWAAEEEEPEEPEAPVPLKEAGMAMQHLPGHTVALTSGQYYARWRGTPEKYGKFAYSTRYGFSVEANDRHFPSAACDSALYVSKDGQHFRMRETCEEVLITGDKLYSRWCPYDDVEVETWLIPAGQWHQRIHVINASDTLEIAEGGFALAKPEFRAWTETLDADRAELHTATDISVVVGYDRRIPTIISPFSNTNLMFARTLVPQLRGCLKPGENRLACAVLARPSDIETPMPDPPELPELSELRALFDMDGQVPEVFEIA